jgi:hypothetical protein
MLADGADVCWRVIYLVYKKFVEIIFYTQYHFPPICAFAPVHNQRFVFDAITLMEEFSMPSTRRADLFWIGLARVMYMRSGLPRSTFKHWDSKGKKVEPRECFHW